MPLLPYDTLVIDSPLPPGEALARLRAATGPRRWFRGFGAATHPFQGEVVGDEVRIERVIGYGNSFLPRIHGRVEPRAHGSRLNATMALHPLVAVFMLVWMAFALATGLPLAALQLARGLDEPAMLTPMGMALAGWLLASGCFTFEARIARERLTALLDARADARSPRAA
jgi:hypothetical protein